MSGRGVGRRGLLLAAVAAFAAACGAGGAGVPDARAVRTPPARPNPKQPAGPPPEPPSPVADLPASSPWQPGGNEISPEVKLAAVRVLEALGTVPDGVAVTPAADRLTAAGAQPVLERTAGPLLPPAGPAVAQIVYPQYGGLERSTASVMAVVRQTWADGAALRERVVTADVRLQRAGSAWTVTELHPVAPVPDAAARLTGPAADLAASGRVQLPEAAVADLAAGIVDARVLAALLELSATYELAVSVFSSGHPETVFGSDRTSNHTRGRAVDIWAVDGRPVVSMDKDEPFLLDFLAAVRATGSDEIGGPVDPDGPGGKHFADDLHRDHVHLGFERN
ncbi:hypothetical protein [Jiangella alkaliphila]|uniref:Uncharacterized protein n=1 Tax=Jiangella alkaliphila TaxID=419479 RepID=A0A1H2GN07_9ACTN|nr:hypothetical protein [Jiangella alkaliphila]SDU20987.1 hypothetical protein SAMN04488563_0587 [Jiangella alkaliphila]